MVSRNLKPGPPPGPKPKMYGPDIVWDPYIHHWVRGNKGVSLSGFHRGQHVRVASERDKFKGIEGQVLHGHDKFGLYVDLDNGWKGWMEPGSLEGAFHREDVDIESDTEDWSDTPLEDLFREQQTIFSYEIESSKS